MGRARAIAGLAIGVPLLAASIAEADRKPTEKERRQIAKLFGIPEPCAHIRVSTVPGERTHATGAYLQAGPAGRRRGSRHPLRLGA